MDRSRRTLSQVFLGCYRLTQAPICVLKHLFFFQAEDGIRDWSVPGVQTCALPISSLPRDDRAPAVPALDLDDGRPAVAAAVAGRSEERRVGKKGRSGWPG